MQPKEYLIWIGTRPEAIKLCPLILEMQARGMKTRVMLSGQHRDMVRPVLDFFGVKAQGDLCVMRQGQSVQALTERLLRGMAEEYAGEKRPDVAVVHGDTTTAFIGALCAFYAGVPVVHIEAGLRSDDSHSPFPEEFNRRAVDAMSDVYFAPTERARERLLKEGDPEGRIFVVGNTATDALRLCLETPIAHPLIDAVGERRLVLLTSHRRETEPSERLAMLRGIRDTIEGRKGVCLVFPVHPSPSVREVARAAFEGCENAILTDPLPLPLMQQLLSRAYLLLTDSGGMQEEAAYLGIPTLVLREVTERPEGVTSGVLRTVGKGPFEVCRVLKELLDHPEKRDEMARSSFVFGDGYAARRIADVLALWEARGSGWGA